MKLMTLKFITLNEETNKMKETLKAHMMKAVLGKTTGRRCVYPERRETVCNDVGMLKEDFKMLEEKGIR